MKFINKIIIADVYPALESLEDDSIDCVVTSPPYWGQRDYEFEGQIGNETSYKEYIEKLLSVFSLLKNKIKSNGIFYLNIGDKYISKYGNSYLGMIPYKLAYFMEKFGWRLLDILIWYKPNHMPSSIQNRLTNTYEPVFVFSKSDKNYFSDYKEKSNFINVLKIPTQPTPFEHVAVYPEKLVETLISFGIPKEGIVLDPFAGSGTTAKAVINLNNNLLLNYNLNFIMIEANTKYADIILKRCGLKQDNLIYLKTKDLKKIKTELEDDFNYNLAFKNKTTSFKQNRGIIKIFQDKEKYFKFLNSMIGGKINNTLTDDGIIYVGTTDFDIASIYETSKLNEKGWVIRNQIVIKNDNTWFPIYFVVKDTKKVEYFFNLDAVRVNHKSSNGSTFDSQKFINYKVIDNITCEKKLMGKVVEIVEKYEDDFPKILLVKWENKKLTSEYVIHNEDTQKYLKFLCPKCKFEIRKYYCNGDTSCPKCKFRLWESYHSIPILIEEVPFKTSSEIKYKNESNELSLLKEKSYFGKFKYVSKINMGASPGARSSTQDEYFSVQRFYNVNQNLVADYLNLKREWKGLSKIEFIKLFPDDYIHTVGHRLRKDMGDSLPQLEDWERLEKILDIEQSYSNYVCRKALKLQVVKNSHKGKNPGDYLEMSINEVKSFLKKTFSD